MKYDITSMPHDKVLVSPSLLAADFWCLERELTSVAEAGADMLHLDVMDGHMVPNISFGVPVIKALRSKCDLLFDTHLMISHPKQYAKAFADAGSDHLTFHLESDDDVYDTIKEIRSVGCTVGISLKPATPAEAVFPYLELVDLVLVMTVEPGFGGQSFMSDMMSKLADITREIKRRSLNVKVQTDGGIDENTVEKVAANGSSVVVAGTAVFRHKMGMKYAVEKLHKAELLLDSAL